MDATHAYARDSAGIVHTATEVRPAKKREAQGARVASGSRSTNTHASSRATRAAQSFPRPTTATAQQTHPNTLPAPQISGRLSQPSTSASSRQLPRPDSRRARLDQRRSQACSHDYQLNESMPGRHSAQPGRGWARFTAGGACRAGSNGRRLTRSARHPLQRSRSSRRSRLTRLRAASRHTASRHTASRHTASRDAASRDAASRDAASRDAASRDAAPHTSPAATLPAVAPPAVMAWMGGLALAPIKCLRARAGEQ